MSTQIIKSDPISAGTAYGALQALADFLDDIAKAIAEGRTEHAYQLTLMAARYQADVMRRISETL